MRHRTFELNLNFNMTEVDALNISYITGAKENLSCWRREEVQDRFVMRSVNNATR